MRRFLERLLNLLRVRRPDYDLAREIDAHLALLQDTYEARGLSPDAARRGRCGCGARWCRGVLAFPVSPGLR